MKQAIERLRQESNEAICKGEAIRALTLAQVAEALEYQMECDAEAQARLSKPPSNSPEYKHYGYQSPTMGESVSRSARALDAIDPALIRRPR